MRARRVFQVATVITPNPKLENEASVTGIRNHQDEMQVVRSSSNRRRRSRSTCRRPRGRDRARAAPGIMRRFDSAHSREKTNLAPTSRKLSSGWAQDVDAVFTLAKSMSQFWKLFGENLGRPL